MNDTTSNYAFQDDLINNYDSGFSVDGEVVAARPDGQADVAQVDVDTTTGISRVETFVAYASGDGAIEGAGLSFVGTDVTVAGILLNPDGTFVVGGDDATNGFYLAKFNSDGSIDTTFGTNGVTYLDGSAADPYQVNVLALDPNGDIVAVGTGVRTGQVSTMLIALRRGRIARYHLQHHWFGAAGL